MKGRAVPESSAAQLPRLFDRVRREWGYPELPVIVADAIAEQIDSLPDSDYSPPASDYGIVAPPFAKCFIEATTHNYAMCILRPGIHEQLPETTTQRGVALYDISTPELFNAIVTQEHRQKYMPVDVRWTLAMFGYIWSSITRRLLTYAGPLFVHLDERGRILDDMAQLHVYEPAKVRGVGMVLAPPDLPTGWRYTYDPMPSWSLPNLAPFVLKAVSAMHQRCEVDKVEPSPAARHRAKKRDRMELNSYYVLNVRPTPTNQLRDFKHIGTPAATQLREHHVRGHFRYYYPERPMLGKYSGSVWIPEHDRGSNTYGAIRKDYKVGPLEEKQHE